MKSSITVSEEYSKRFLVLESYRSSTMPDVVTEVLAEFDSLEEAVLRVKNLSQVSPFSYQVVPNPHHKS